MFRDELNIKYLPESMILRYLRNESSEKERYIVDRLKTKNYNLENFLSLESMYKNGELKKQDPSEEEYRKFIDIVKKNIAEDSNPKLTVSNQQVEPRAGQIWSTKAIPQPEVFGFEPVVFPKFVYLLTDPQPFQLLEEHDYVLELKDFYTMIVLPISIDTKFATHKDYLINSLNDLIGIDFMIETWLETNMIVCNLEKYIGTLDDNQINEVLNVYYASNGLEFDQEIYDRANKGRYHDDDHGDINEFQRLEVDNIEYLNEPVNKLYDFLYIDRDIVRNIIELIETPELALAARDDTILSPGEQKVYSESVIFADRDYEVKLVVLEKGQLYFRLKVKTETNEKRLGTIKITNKKTNDELLLIDGINLNKAISYLKVDKQIKNNLVEISFIVDGDLHFIKNIDFT